MNVSHFINSVWASAVAASLAILLLLLSYFILEPVVSRAQSDVFEVSQTIISELSFAASTSDVVMSPSINGLTGGYASGSTQARIRTNNSTGYELRIRFGTSTGVTNNIMWGDVNNGSIGNYAPTAPGTPDYNFSDPTSGTPSKFAFTVLASTSDDVTGSFEDNGSNTCGSEAGGSFTVGRCWMAPTTTAFQIIDSSAATPDSGATSTIQFKVAVPSSPNPALPNDIYVATVTLTAVTNP